MKRPLIISILFYIWERIYHHKEFGGLGLGKFEDFNTTMLSKATWDIVTKPKNYLLMFQCQIHKKSNFFFCSKQNIESFIWKGILGSRETIKKFVCRKIADGSIIDPWIPGIKEQKLSINLSQRRGCSLDYQNINVIN